jgi:hypothetical protein
MSGHGSASPPVKKRLRGRGLAPVEPWDHQDQRHHWNRGQERESEIVAKADGLGQEPAHHPRHREADAHQRTEDRKMGGLVCGIATAHQVDHEHRGPQARPEFFDRDQQGQDGHPDRRARGNVGECHVDQVQDVLREHERPDPPAQPMPGDQPPPGEGGHEAGKHADGAVGEPVLVDAHAELAVEKRPPHLLEERFAGAKQNHEREDPAHLGLIEEHDEGAAVVGVARLHPATQAREHGQAHEQGSEQREHDPAGPADPGERGHGGDRLADACPHRSEQPQLALEHDQQGERGPDCEHAQTQQTGQQLADSMPTDLGPGQQQQMKDRHCAEHERGREQAHAPPDHTHEDQQGPARGQIRQLVGHRPVAHEPGLARLVERLHVVAVDGDVVGGGQKPHHHEHHRHHADQLAHPDQEREHDDQHGEHDLHRHQPRPLGLEAIQERSPQELEVPRQVKQRGQPDRLQARPELLKQHLGQIDDDRVRIPLGEVGGGHPRVRAAIPLHARRATPSLPHAGLVDARCRRRRWFGVAHERIAQAIATPATKTATRGPSAWP